MVSFQETIVTLWVTMETVFVKDFLKICKPKAMVEDGVCDLEKLCKKSGIPYLGLAKQKIEE